MTRRASCDSWFAIASCLLLAATRSTSALQFQTSTTVRGVSKKELHRFLATPSNWPRFVPSSFGVEPLSSSNGREAKVDSPFRAGDRVEEVFGLPPIIPLTFGWTCEKADEETGELSFYSAEGIENFATDCRMTFDVTDGEENNSSLLKFSIGYEAASPLAVLATPVLAIDTTLAVKAFLPLVLRFK